MNIRLSLFRAAACAVAILGLTTSARADTVVSFVPAVTGHVWRVPGNLQNAPTSDPSGAGILTDEGTFTASQIDFSASGTGSLSSFLNFHGSGVNTAGITSGLAQSMSSCSGVVTTSSTCYSTVIHIGSLAANFVAGLYGLTHDDGANMFLNGSQVVNSPTPTNSITNTFTVASALTGKPFDIWYMATNLNPEVLRLGVTPSTPQVPEPASVILLGTVLVGLAAIKRRQMRRS